MLLSFSWADNVVVLEFDPKPVLFHFSPADNLTADQKDQTH